MKRKYTILFFILLLFPIIFISYIKSPAEEKRTNIFWVHGTKIKPSEQGPQANIAILPAKDGAYITGKGTQTFHVPLTTPAITENTEVFLAYVTLLFKTEYGAKIKRISIHDSGRSFFSNPYAEAANLNLDGDYTQFDPKKGRKGYRIGIAPRDKSDYIQGGINVEVEVELGSSDIFPLYPPRLYFQAAGFEFWRYWD